jgi:predicted negative regulator of RcsB-dependent stress response
VRHHRARGVLSTSFAISRDAMLAMAGADAPAWSAALGALGWAPRAGLGPALGAAITCLDGASGGFDDFIEAAVSVSLARRLPSEERATAAWAVHPLLGEFLRGDTPRAAMDDRIAAWVEDLAADHPSDRRARWDALAAETASIGEWLGTAPAEAIGRAVQPACMFALSRGPIAPWLAAARRACDQGATTDLLWVICRLAFRAGELDTVLEAANAMERMAQASGDEYRRAFARSRIANVLAARGQLDEALRIHREETLPVYERRGEERERANALGKVADLLAARGELDEALRIRREEVLPAYEQLGDVRSHAYTLGKIADALARRGALAQALQIWREEELPVYERIGEVREHAVVLGKIGDALVERGERARALDLWREALGVFEKLREPQMIETARLRIARHGG